MRFYYDIASSATPMTFVDYSCCVHAFVAGFTDHVADSFVLRVFACVPQKVVRNEWRCLDINFMVLIPILWMLFKSIPSVFFLCVYVCVCVCAFPLNDRCCLVLFTLPRVAFE